MGFIGWGMTELGVSGSAGLGFQGLGVSVLWGLQGFIFEGY